MAGDLERATGSRRGLLEQEHNILAFKILMRRSCQLQSLELFSKRNKVANLVRSEIEKLQIVTTAQTNRHENSFR